MNREEKLQVERAKWQVHLVREYLLMFACDKDANLHLRNVCTDARRQLVKIEWPAVTTVEAFYKSG